MNKNQLCEYNYVILGGRGYFHVGYHDVKKMPNVRYYESIFDGLSSKIKKSITRITVSKTTNKYWHLPLSSSTFRNIFPNDFPKHKPICFIFFRSYFKISHEYIAYLKKKYHCSRFVMYFQDRVDLTPDIDIKQIAKDFDLVYSYNKKDCEKYGLLYYPTPYSEYSVPEDESLPGSDVFFCGKAKNRYNTIFSTYTACKQQGLNCDFYVTGLPNGVKTPEGIHINESLTYIQYLQHLCKSKMIVDIMQEGVDGFTPRVWESIMYDKHLLTNSKELSSSSFYNKRYMHDLDVDLKEVEGLVKTTVHYSEEAKESLSPINLLKDIERRLRLI